MVFILVLSLYNQCEKKKKKVKTEIKKIKNVKNWWSKKRKKKVAIYRWKFVGYKHRFIVFIAAAVFDDNHRRWW